MNISYDLAKSRNCRFGIQISILHVNDTRWSVPAPVKWLYHWETLSELIQVMDWHMCGTTLLPYSRLHPEQPISMKFHLKFLGFHLWKYSWKHRLQNHDIFSRPQCVNEYRDSDRRRWIDGIQITGNACAMNKLVRHNGFLKTTGLFNKRFFNSNSNSMPYFSFVCNIFIHVTTSTPDEQKVVAVIYLHFGWD